MTKSIIFNRTDDSYEVLTATGKHIVVQHDGDEIPTDVSVTLTPREAAALFPEAKAALKKMIKEAKESLSKIPELRRRAQKMALKACAGNPSRADKLYNTFDQDVIVPLENKAKAILDEHTKRLRYFKGGKKTKGKGITDQDIETAKAVPISDYIQFNRGHKACCIWHDENTPSMHYYEKDNRVKCFGCGKHGDTIEVVSALLGLDFIGAVRHINGGGTSSTDA